MTGYTEENSATEVSKNLKEELELVLVTSIFLPILQLPKEREKTLKSYEIKRPFSYQLLTWHYSLTPRGIGIAPGLQTFTRKPNSKLQCKREDKTGQRQLICSKANPELMPMHKQKRLK